MAKAIESDLAIIDKRRPRANVAEIMNIIGDVAGRTCIITDDIVDYRPARSVRCRRAQRTRALVPSWPTSRTRCSRAQRSNAFLTLL